MAKRFTDTEIWDKEWYMSLSCKHKCLVRFIFDKCDQAGVWSANWMLASTYIGEKVSPEDLAELGDRVEKIGENKYFVPDFIEFQYGVLTEDCRPHRNIIALLQKHSLYERVLKGYQKDTNTHKDKDKEKGKDKDKDEGGVGETEDPVEVFETFRKKYPGTKRGRDTELKTFKKQGDWKTALPELMPALGREVVWREEARRKGAFCPDWPNLQTWLNQRRWEQELKPITHEDRHAEATNGRYDRGSGITENERKYGSTAGTKQSILERAAELDRRRTGGSLPDGK